MIKLYCLKSEKKIAGICAGIGDIFSFDANLVRIVFVFVCVATALWPMVVAYLVGWLLLPDKPIDKEIPSHRDNKDAPTSPA